MAQRTPGRYTIHDIAHELGVSARTVSRVINEQPGVGRATRERVAAFVREVNFHPHSGARSLRRQRIDCIGVAVTSPHDIIPISDDVLSWLFFELNRIFQSGEFIGFDLNPPLRGDEYDYARGVSEQRFGACVVAGPLRTHDTIIHRIHDAGCPYMVMGRLDSFPEVSCATVDYEAAAYLSTKFLIDQGHTRVGLLLGLDGFQPGVERRRGYGRALEEAGIPFDDSLVRPAGFDTEQNARLTHRLLLERDVTAIVESSGAEDGGSIREGARRAGRMPGENLDIVEWTYTYRAAVVSEARAHVWLPLREAGSEGLELLADWFYERRAEPFQVVYQPILYDTPHDTEPAPWKPIFTTHT
ncbi:MAG: LacI family DNA-binding transcriptional regulator [Candidatus Hydrogenedentes bacterium]|nr:LacI family DNA-binding transcriptional regulator [Candidatus Hydrogenedentota bacterium]